jgi:hypothetical protein
LFEKIFHLVQAYYNKLTIKSVIFYMQNPPLLNNAYLCIAIRSIAHSNMRGKSGQHRASCFLTGRRRSAGDRKCHRK